MSQKAISNSNPEIHVQNTAPVPAPEPVLVGSANQVIRFVALIMLGVILVVSYFSVENLKALKDSQREVGILSEKVKVLEDIVINKFYTVKE